MTVPVSAHFIDHKGVLPIILCSWPLSGNFILSESGYKATE